MTRRAVSKSLNIHKIQVLSLRALSLFALSLPLRLAQFSLYSVWELLTQSSRAGFRYSHRLTHRSPGWLRRKEGAEQPAERYQSLSDIFDKRFYPEYQDSSSVQFHHCHQQATRRATNQLNGGGTRQLRHSALTRKFHHQPDFLIFINNLIRCRTWFPLKLLIITNVTDGLYFFEILQA